MRRCNACRFQARPSAYVYHDQAIEPESVYPGRVVATNEKSTETWSVISLGHGGLLFILCCHSRLTFVFFYFLSPLRVHTNQSAISCQSFLIFIASVVYSFLSLAGSFLCRLLVLIVYCFLFCIPFNSGSWCCLAQHGR